MSETVDRWVDYLVVAQDALHDFAEALQEIATDEEFMAAYAELARRAGDILDDVRVPNGGGIDDLREVFVISEGRLQKTWDALMMPGLEHLRFVYEVERWWARGYDDEDDLRVYAVELATGPGSYDGLTFEEV